MTAKSKLSVFVGVAVLVAIAAFALIIRNAIVSAPRYDGDEPESDAQTRRIDGADPSAPAATQTAEESAAEKRKRRRERIAKAKPIAESIDSRDDLTYEEKSILKSIEDAVDTDSLAALRKILPAAAASSNPEIRSELVDGLGWFGDKAVLDLLPFMADKDSDVAESAISHWTSAVSDVGEKRRAKLVEETMKIITDKDTLEEIVDQLDDLDDVRAIQVCINLIDSGNENAAEVAREHYEFVTGEEYTTFEAAEEWLKENYVSDDDDDAPAAAATETTETAAASEQAGSSEAPASAESAAPAAQPAPAAEVYY
ncbi:MAG: hypothetical protein J6U17_03085 [Kiritimatiellae bacterium]|nr:hypothetical protein [Kiritimatiellia bacterium]